VLDFDSSVAATTRVELLKVKEAKSPKKRSYFTTAKASPTLYKKIMSSPFGVGTDVGVISGGGPGQVLENSGVIQG
jgi:hypothetical protein